MGGGLFQQYTKDDSRRKAMRDVWEISYLNSQAKERVGYPTQKPITLLKRIIQASSNYKDMVLDPFCGCATACIAAEMEEREWVGIDISPKAADLVERRMVDEVGVLYAGNHRTDIPHRTDMGLMLAYNDPRNKKHLYGEQGGYCNGCETHFQPRYFEVDHIIPKAKGGTDHISNLQLLCSPCNKLKSTRSHEELLVLLTDKGWIKRKKAA
ncbi:MAG: DNA methyltransferase [Gemmatimonadota bacterium]|nr:DNA methyltransferase [Gemmatimonadota bacterium]